MGCNVSICQWCAMFHGHVNMLRTAHRKHHDNPEEKKLNSQKQHSYNCKYIQTDRQMVIVGQKEPNQKADYH